MSDIDSEAPIAVPRRRNNPAGVRGSILDAAFELFQAQGYAATSVHQIASLSGVTGGALHHHFPLKKAIGLAVIGERVAPALDEAWLDPLGASGNPRTAILEIFETIARDLDRQGKVRGCPVNNLTLELAFADSEFREALARLFDGWRSAVREKLAGHEDSDALAALIIASYSGAMALAKVEQNGRPLRLCASRLAEILPSTE